MHPVHDVTYPTRQLRRAALREEARFRFFRANPLVKTPEGTMPLDHVAARVYPLTLPRRVRRVGMLHIARRTA